MNGIAARLDRLLFKPVDIAGLVFFRVAFGSMMAFDTARYVAFGWVEDNYLDPALLLRYPGFGWIGTPTEPLMYALFAVTALGAAGVAVGYRYRLSAITFFLGHTYIFLLSAAQYLNHAYLISLIAFLIIFMPADRAASLDTWRDPTRHRSIVPAWPLLTLATMVAVVYVFGSIAKMNPDWLRGEPMRRWLGNIAHKVPVGGSIFGSEAFLWLTIYGGLVFDLCAPGLLWWRRTRLIATVISFGFHLTNAYMFSIGIFPWMMLAATTLFFEPDWPRRVPGLGESFDELLAPWREDPPPDAEALATSPAQAQRVRLGLGLYFAIQLLLPLRHHLYPGDVAWTEEGHYLAWRMKLRDKIGHATFHVTSPTLGKHWRVPASEQLTQRQARKLAGKPDLILQYAHYLRDAYQKETGAPVEVRANVPMALNDRAPRPYVDTKVDLAKEPFRWGPYPWIVPFDPYAETAGPKK